MSADEPTKDIPCEVVENLGAAAIAVHTECTPRDENPPMGAENQISTPTAPRFHPPPTTFWSLRARLPQRRISILGIVGALIFFGLWETGHYFLPAEKARFLPTVEDVFKTLFYLFLDKGYTRDVLVSCYRIFVSFFAACIIAVPLGIGMGCFASLRALVNPTASGWRYLPATSFIPLLLVWFGPTDLAKMGVLWIGVLFFLLALVLDNTEAVLPELVEAALTMGATRKEVVLGVVTRAAAPAIMDSMRNMIAVGWTYLVIAEIVGANEGIGAVMMRAGRFLHVDIIMAGILTIGILGVLTDVAFRLARTYMFRWAVAQRG